MTCRLFGAKPLLAILMIYIHSEPWEQISVEFNSRSNYIHAQKWLWLFNVVCKTTTLSSNPRVLTITGPDPRLVVEMGSVANYITSLQCHVRDTFLNILWVVLERRLMLLTWWRHHMKTFSAVLAFCAGNSPVTGEFPSQRPVMRSFDVFFDLRLNQQLSKQWRHRWFEMPSHSSWPSLL